MNVLKPVNENKGLAHRTSRIRPQDIPGLAKAVAIIKKYFIVWDEWDLMAWDGSLTLQRKNDSRMVIKVFVDVDGNLCLKSELQVPNHLQGTDNLVVGVELTHIDSYIRDSIRDRLKADFHDQYCDPRNGSQKVCLKPIFNHNYDILIIPQGDACLDLTNAEIDEIKCIIVSVNEIDAF